MQNKKPGARKFDSTSRDRSAASTTDTSAPLRIGLTGNIGSGKSTAAALFSELGVPVFDTDTIGHELLESDPLLRARIVKIFGDSVIDGGFINRRKIAEAVFRNPQKRKTLEGLLHPAIMSAVEARVAALAGHPYAVIEAPLLYEARLAGQFDYIILVKADEEKAVARASAKLGITREEVIKRLAAQIPPAEKEKLADFVISNNESPEELRKRIELLHSIIASLANGALTGD